MYQKKDSTVVMSLADHVWAVLKANYDNGNHWLNASEIAVRVISNVLGRPEDKALYGQVIMPKSIKASMNAVRAIGEAEHHTVVAERKFEDDNGKALKGWIVTGWRISTPEDGDYINHEILIRATMRNGVSKSIQKIEGRHPNSFTPAIEE